MRLPVLEGVPVLGLLSGHSALTSVAALSIVMPGLLGGIPAEIVRAIPFAVTVLAPDLLSARSRRSALGR